LTSAAAHVILAKPIIYCKHGETPTRRDTNVDILGQRQVAIAFARQRRDLPVPAQPLIGRRRERELLLQRLADENHRLISITGPGGVGKSRLALELAHTLAHNVQRFPDGVAFVALAPLRQQPDLPDLLASLVAEAFHLDLSGPGTPFSRLPGALRQRHLLLVLDNCEHLPGVSAFVSELQQSCPGLSVLATSRASLGLRGELVLALDGLSVPESEDRTASNRSVQRISERYEAVQLFVHAAQLQSADFTLTAANSRAVIQICQLVDGLPLGIELAASWTPVLSCAEIAAEIEQNLDFLASDGYDVPARQRSLRAVFDSSWEALSAVEQGCLRRMAFFYGSFTSEAAAHVAATDRRTLAALLKKSLLRRTSKADDGIEARFALLGPLRQYAYEHLLAAGEYAHTDENHRRYYLEFLTNQGLLLHGAEQQDVLQAIALELAEIRVAWQSAISANDGAILDRAAHPLFTFCIMSSRFSEGAALLGGAAQALGTRHDQQLVAAHGRILARAGWCLFQLGRSEQARQQLEESLQLLRQHGSPQDLIVPLNYLASIARHTGEGELALALAREGMELSEGLGDRYGTVITATTLSQIYYVLGHFAEAEQYAEQSLQLERLIGNRWGTVFNLITLGQIVLAAGRAAQAREFFQEALLIRSQFNDARGMALCLGELGDAAMLLGEHDVAGWCYEQSYNLFQAIGNAWGLAIALHKLGRLASRGGHYSAAARLLSAALEIALDLDATPQLVIIGDTITELLQRAGHPGLASTPDDQRARLRAQRTLLARWPEAIALPLDEAITQAIAAPANAPVQAQRPTILTPRETEVLRLVAQGLTDAQVAEQLVLSTRTVNSYLTSIYSKLQVGSRSAATRWAVEHGLA
jgi:predicted ATPase/DNA-binding CsgD family transcriptional regulator